VTDQPRIKLILLVAMALGATRLACADSPIERSVNENEHTRLLLTKDVSRIAVGSSAHLSFELISNREILLLGKKAGRTTLMLWFSDGSFEEQLVDVHRDLSVLQRALADIDSSIVVEGAPDRDALILRGTVPNIGASRAAEATAVRYLTPTANRFGGGQDQATPLIRAPGAAPPASPPGGTPATTPEQAAAEAVRPPGAALASPTVINLLKLRTLPPRLEERLFDAILPLGGRDLTVRRVVKGAVPDDTNDVFVLEGSVRDQITLIRALTLANSVVVGKQQQAQITVIANEAGATLGGSSGTSASQAGTSGGGGLGATTNNIQQNIARAKVLETARGQIVSFIRVRDLPQVRVAIRLYEVDRTKLRQWGFNSTVPAANIPQPNAIPGALTTPSTLPVLAARGPSHPLDVQNIFSFLNGGVANQTQIVGKYFAINTALSFLESEGLARNLSGPTLTVLSGENASFNSGDQIFIPLNTAVSNGAVLTTTFTAIQVGVTLSIRPLVGDDDTVTLDVVPQVSAPDLPLTQSINQSTGVNSVAPAIQTRQLQTSARLDDGEALLLGGLVTRDRSDNASYIPFLGEIPGIEWFFKQTSHNEDDKELVIVVNPTIVREPSKASAVWAFQDTRDLLRSSTGRSAPH